MNKKIAVIGLGYVGLPLAHAFSEKYEVVGFDINISRIDELNNAYDRTLELDETQIQPPPNIGSKYKSEFIYGMAKVEDNFIMLLDMEKVFSTDDIISVKEKTAEGEVQIEEKEEVKKKKSKKK